MAMEVTSGRGFRFGRAKPEMNVTPLVDVVLVLLIIFMVIAPLLGKQFWVHHPDRRQAEPANTEPEEGEGPVVVSVGARGRARINREEVADGDLAHRVHRILAARGGRTVFFDAAEGVSFGRAAAVMDLVRAGGASTIAVLTEPLEEAP